MLTFGLARTFPQGTFLTVAVHRLCHCCILSCTTLTFVRGWL
jgi:hypothetical protein